jgi:hypothetical protein
VRERLLLSGFALPEASDYQALTQIAQRPAPVFEQL